MSEYTREEILKLIEENGGPRGLGLSKRDLSGIDLRGSAILIELESRKRLDPEETPVWFSAERGLGGINLQSALLDGANLQGASLSHANLRGAILIDADLKGAHLVNAGLQGAVLLSANLEGANLASTDLQGACLLSANLQGAKLSSTNLQEAQFDGAHLQGTVMMWANLQGARLHGANLQGAFLQYSHLEKVDFFVGKSLEGAYFYNAFLDNTRMRREQLGKAIGEELREKYDWAKEAYLALKNNFAEIGRYRDESWAYVKERQMGKMMHHPRLARVYYRDELPENPNAWRLAWFYIRHTAKWLTDWFVELLCSYGESLWRVLAWMLLVIVGFAAYYQVSHAVVTSSQDAATSLWDHLIFSLGAFTTLQPARLQAARPGVELLTTVQAIIGISLAGLLGFVAGNRIRRS